MVPIALIASAIYIGVLAQKGRGRTGAFWGAATFALGLMLVTYVTFTVFDMPEYARLKEHPWLEDAFFALIGPGLATFIMTIVVATLPRR